MKLTFVALIIVFVLGHRTVICITNNVAHLLRYNLLRYYDSFTEPPTTNKSALFVSADPFVLGIDVDYLKSSFQLFGWLKMKWEDPRLTWDPSKYGDLKTIHFAQNEIWKPQIFATNRLDAHVIENYSQNLIIVGHNGDAIFVPMTNFKVLCDLDYSDWPFDKQKCELILRITGTRTTPMYFNSTHKNDVNEGIVSDWQIEGVHTLHVMIYHHLMCDGIVSDLHFKFHVRKSEIKYYGFFILPAFGMCFLLLSTFWLPLRSAKKLTLEIISLILPIIFLLFFSRMVPMFHQQLPKIILFYSWLMFLSAFHILTSFILNYMVTSESLHSNPVAQNIKTLFDHPVLQCLHLVPDSVFVRHQLQKMDPSQKLNENYTKYQWFSITMIINRILFLFYAIIMTILMLICFN